MDEWDVDRAYGVEFRVYAQERQGVTYPEDCIYTLHRDTVIQ